jgi:hypothetical protein
MKNVLVLGGIVWIGCLATADAWSASIAARRGVSPPSPIQTHSPSSTQAEAGSPTSSFLRRQAEAGSPTWSTQAEAGSPPDRRRNAVYFVRPPIPPRGSSLQGR